MKTVRALTAVLATGTLLVAGCGRGGPGGGGDDKVSGGKIVLAVLNDQSGVYADLSGRNSVEAVRMAVADFQAKYGDRALAKDIEVVTADHKNKPDIANSKAQELYDPRRPAWTLTWRTSPPRSAVAPWPRARRSPSYTTAPPT